MEPVQLAAILVGAALLASMVSVHATGPTDAQHDRRDRRSLRRHDHGPKHSRWVP